MRVLTDDDVAAMDGVNEDNVGAVCLFDNHDTNGNDYEKQFCNALIYISNHTNDE